MNLIYPQERFMHLRIQIILFQTFRIMTKNSVLISADTNYTNQFDEEGTFDITVLLILG